MWVYGESIVWRMVSPLCGCTVSPLCVCTVSPLCDVR